MVALAFVIFLRRNVIPQASLVRFVKKTSMTAYQNRATMVCVKMASPPSPVSAMLDTQAPSVISRYRSATAIPVRTEDAALTSSMPTSATAHREPQVCTTLISCLSPVCQVGTLPPMFLQSLIEGGFSHFLFQNDVAATCFTVF